MAQINVRVRTAEKVIPELSMDKFYRTYEVDGVDVAIWQWGSQRTGRVAGQFKKADKATAVSQFSKKRAENYQSVADYRFQMDDSVIRQILADNKSDVHKRIGQVLDNVRASNEDGKRDSAVASSRGTTMGAAPTEAQAVAARTGGDMVLTLADKLQSAIATAVDKPGEAMGLLADLKEELADVKEQTVRLESFFETLQMLAVDAVMGR